MLSQFPKFSKTCVKLSLSKRPQIGFQDQLSLNAGQKYCKMLQWEHSAILSTLIKLLFVIKIFVLSIFEFYEVLLYYVLATRLNPIHQYIQRYYTETIGVYWTYVRTRVILYAQKCGASKYSAQQG